MLLFWGVILLRNAWLSDDAYITFRVVDNFVHGHGLRWNVDQRVQVFTHPLWFFLLSALYFVTREIHFTAMFLSCALSLGVAALLFFRAAKSPYSVALTAAALTASKAFMDFSTSGLENPLSHLLLVLFLIVYLGNGTSDRRFFALFFIAGLATLNRMDTLLLYLPAIAAALVAKRSWKGIALAGLAFAPFVAWELFSIAYYGFPFPNTAYAKLITGVPQETLRLQGICYLANSLSMDPATLTVITLGGIAACFSPHRSRLLLVLAGTLSYLLYIVWIGGDFMSGRFLSIPMLAGMCLLLAVPIVHMRSPAITLTAIVMILGFAGQFPPLLSDARYGLGRGDTRDDKMVTDERANYYPYTGLLRVNRTVPLPMDHPWAQEGIALRTGGETVVATSAGAGFAGFFAGPRIHLVEPFAICDPLLARIRPDRWGMHGHFYRELPSGYLESLRTGQDVFEDPGLNAFHAKLRVITQGPLFTRDRLRAIVSMNFGRYDDLLPVKPPPKDISPTLPRPR